MAKRVVVLVGGIISSIFMFVIAFYLYIIGALAHGLSNGEAANLTVIWLMLAAAIVLGIVNLVAAILCFKEKKNAKFMFLPVSISLLAFAVYVLVANGFEEFFAALAVIAACVISIIITILAFTIKDKKKEVVVINPELINEHNQQNISQ